MQARTSRAITLQPAEPEGVGTASVASSSALPTPEKTAVPKVRRSVSSVSAGAVGIPPAASHRGGTATRRKRQLHVPESLLPHLNQLHKMFPKVSVTVRSRPPCQSVTHSQRQHLLLNMLRHSIDLQPKLNTCGYGLRRILSLSLAVCVRACVCVCVCVCVSLAAGYCRRPDEDKQQHAANDREHPKWFGVRDSNCGTPHA